jgi:hypothetical protein
MCKYSQVIHADPSTAAPAASPVQSLYSMRWLKTTLKSSFMALLGSGDVTSSRLEGRTEEIRQFILDELGEFAEKHYPHITRANVMAVLGAMHGETIAREKVGRITDKFEGLLPHGLSSRPSSLTH